MSVDDDRASDRRFLALAGALMAVEIVLGYLADAGVFGLAVWLVLAVAAILLAGAAFRIVSGRESAR